ncbi:MAG: AAA family ATPase [Helicobacteraceae bacterium]|nr:AAA family ATPase [Helicobacteraceae bacterium]
MIERLLIKDSPAFREVILNPNKGFNTFSGVSGSGKSVLMESILAIFGLKDSNALLIEATFNKDYLYLDDSGILFDDENILSIIKKDKIKYFFNNQTLSKKRIKEIFSQYVKYINSQSKIELQQDNLLKILDSIIVKKMPQYSQKLESYRINYNAFLSKKVELQKLENEEKNIIELREFAAFEINQIESINPKINEYDELLEIKKALSKKEKTMQKIHSLKPILGEFSNITSFLDSINKNKPIFDEVLNEIFGIIIDEEERLNNIDESDIEEILNRIEKLSNLVHKYGSIEEALEYLKKRKKDLENYQNISFNKNALTKELDSLLTTIKVESKEIRDLRKQNLNILLKELQSYCKRLMLNSPSVNLVEVELDSNGADLLEVRLGVSEISTLSSGEFNRLKLAILCIEIEYSKQSGILILDEIDANLSGKESEGVAEVLSFLSRDYQIFAISHQSHMPSFASHHYLVQKGKDKSSITLLNKQGRINEIARMISGANITPEALLFAQEKLKNLKE